MTMNSKKAKRRPVLSIQLSEDLEAYLREHAEAGYRSLSKEVAMRLEHSRQVETQQARARQGLAQAGPLAK